MGIILWVNKKKKETEKPEMKIKAEKNYVKTRQ